MQVDAKGVVMAKFLIVPVNVAANIFKAGVLLYLAIKNQKKDIAYIRTIQSNNLTKQEKLLETELGINNNYALNVSSIDTALCSGKINDLSEQIAAYCYSEDIRHRNILLVEGVAPDNDRPYLFDFNHSIATILKAEVIFLVDAKAKDESKVAQLIQIMHDYSFGPDTKKLGFILINAGDNLTEYTYRVSQTIAKNKINLACLLATEGDLENLNYQDLIQLANQVDCSAIDQVLKFPIDNRLAPSVYRIMVIEKAKQANKKIVLPEGAEIRTIQAAIICHEKKIARCVLLADPEQVAQVVFNLGLTLPQDIEIIDPKIVSDKLVQPLMDIRKHKELSEDKAKILLANTIWVGTMMLQIGEVDGLVSGATHTTADTIRPALKIIKMNPHSSIVSSIFFMLMPNEVYVFGDCAVNIKLSAEQMAEVAIQAADSALAFGINPKVAMISYSTKDSGFGPSVDKVKQATKIVIEKRPDIVVDGPLQYDAACVPSVGQKRHLIAQWLGMLMFLFSLI